MAVRDDLEFHLEGDSTVDRYIIVKSPSKELTVQDLVDTIRDYEDGDTAISYCHLLNAAGKDVLGGGVLVGVTATLLNCKVGFEARLGPSFVQCSISGGNLVALGPGDSLSCVGDSNMSPILTTAYTQVTLTSSSSATLQELDAIQYSSYQNAVWIDTVNGDSGIEFPVGTREHPVNNIPQAVLIANSKGFDRISVLGDLTLGSGDSIINFIIEGQSPALTDLTIGDAAETLNCEIRECHVNGILDGGTTIVNCEVNTVTYVNGHIHDSWLIGTITLGGSEAAHFFNCHSGIAGTGTSEIDCGGSGRDLSIRGYNGGILISNKTGAGDNISVDLVSGQVKLANTVTAGQIVCRGVGKLTDTSGNHILSGPWNGANIVNETINKESITQTTWNTVYIDTVNGNSGTYFPLGTMGNPVDNIANAKTIADERNITSFHVKGDTTLHASFNGCIFESNSPYTGKITLNNQDVDDCVFKNIQVDGTQNGNVRAVDCLFDDVTGIEGEFSNCWFSGNFQIPAGKKMYSFESHSTDLFPMEFDLSGNGILIYYGTAWITVKNLTNSAGLAAFSGDIGVTGDSTCTDGAIYVTGSTVIDADNTAGASIVRTYQNTYKTWNYVQGAGDTTMYQMIANIWDEAGGDRLIVNNREYFYNSAGDTSMAFVLLDESGDSTMTNVYERVKFFPA